MPKHIKIEPSEGGGTKVTLNRWSIGDRVEIGDANSEEFDHGTVVALIAHSRVSVRWDLSGDTYTEESRDLRASEIPEGA